MSALAAGLTVTERAYRRVAVALVTDGAGGLTVRVMDGATPRPVTMAWRQWRQATPAELAAIGTLPILAPDEAGSYAASWAAVGAWLTRDRMAAILPAILATGTVGGVYLTV